MNTDNTRDAAEPSLASAGSQLDAVRAKLIECDREAALRGWPDTGWPRLWFSALSRAAGLDLRPTQPSMAGPGLGRSIRSPAACDPLTPAMMELIEKTRLTDEEREAIDDAAEDAEIEADQRRREGEKVWASHYDDKARSLRAIIERLK
jgi:hypothetical protein